MFLNRWSRFFSETVILNSCFRNRCFVSSLQTVFRNSVVPKTVLPFLLQNGVTKIGVAKLVLYLLSKNGVTKSVWPNLVVSNRSYEIGALVSLLKRDPNLVLWNSVFRFFYENGVPKFGDLNRCYRFFSKRCSPKSVSRNRCSRFLFLKRCSEIRCSRIWWSQKRCYEIGALVSLLKRDPNSVFFNSVLWNSVFRFLHENGVPKFGDLNRCYRFSFSKTVFPKSVLRNRCSRFLFLKRCSEIRYSRIWWSQKRCYEIGVTVSSVKRWSANRCHRIWWFQFSKRYHEIGVPLSPRKRCPEIRWFQNSVPKTVLRNRCDRFFRETVVPKIGITEFGDLNSQNGITKSVFCFLHENGVPKFGDSKNGVPKTVFRNRCFRFFLKRWSRKSVLPNLVVSKTVSRNRCSRFLFLKRWSRKSVFPKLVIPNRCSRF